MIKKFLILFCLIINVYYMYGLEYEPFSTPTPTYEYKFKSTSPVNMRYYTVRPLNSDGTVSMEYITSKPIDNLSYNGGLDLDDDDDPNACKVPVGDTPYIMLIICIFIYALFIKFKKQKIIKN